MVKIVIPKQEDVKDAIYLGINCVPNIPDIIMKNQIVVLNVYVTIVIIVIIIKILILIYIFQNIFDVFLVIL